MFWPVMFEAASNVGPEGPLKKMPILVLEIPGHTASSHAHTASTQAQQTADSRQPIDDRDSEQQRADSRSEHSRQQTQQHEFDVHAAVAECSNKVCCTSKGATAKKKPDVCTNIRI